MAWTDLSAAFGYGTKLTSTQQQQLRDNVVHVHAFVNSASLTDHGPLLGSGKGAITAMGVGSDGMVMIGQNGADPQWKTLSGVLRLAASGAVTISNNAFNNYTAGNYIELASDTEEQTAQTSYTILKQFRITKAGTLRIKFSLATASAGIIAYGRIYKNGSSWGTERSTTKATYTEYSEDLAGWAVGDTIDLYVKTQSGSYAAMVRNFRVYAANPIMPQVLS